MSNNDYMINLVIEFINSSYSLNRFCFNKDLDLTLFKNHTLRAVRKQNPDLLIKLENNIKEKELIKNNQIKDDIFVILENIKNNPKYFGLIDICLLSNYSILELISECDKYLKGEDRILFRKTIRPLKPKNSCTIKDLKQLVNSRFVYNIDGELVEMSQENKQTVVDFFIQNNIPIYTDTFKNGCIKLYQKKLFPNKVK